MSSRSAEGDPRAPRAIGDITSTVIPPTPDLGLEMDRARQAATTIQRGYRRLVRVRGFVVLIHSSVRRIYLAHRGAQARIVSLAGYRKEVLRHLEGKVADPLRLATLRYLFYVHVGRAIRGEERALLQPHTDGVLALRLPAESVSPESTPTRVGGNTRATPTLGNVLHPHTDGVLAPPIIVEPESKDSTPRDTLVGGERRASPTLGNEIAKKVHGTRLSTRLASLQNETDAAKTAPNNQHTMLPALMLTRSSSRTITMIQVWYRCHSLLRSCVQQNRALHST